MPLPVKNNDRPLRGSCQDSVSTKHLGALNFPASMKLNLPSEVRLLSFALTGVLLCFETGCKPKADGAAQDNKLVSSNSLVERNANSVTGPALEHDPAKRPLVLSQPASSRRQWILQVLNQGYHETGRTNAEWDAKVQTAFEA